MMKEESDRQACLQAVRSSGKGSPKVNSPFATVALYYQLMPFDGSESVLAQMITELSPNLGDGLKDQAAAWA